MKKKVTIDEFQRSDLPRLADVVSFSNSLNLSLYSNSTVVKSPEVVLRGLITSRNRLLGEEYLLNFQRHDLDYGLAVGVANFSLPMVADSLSQRDLVDDPAGVIKLPAYEQIKAPLGPVMRSRRSVRSYSGEPLSLRTLSTLLFSVQGVTGSQDETDPPETLTFGPRQPVRLRATPSGGALYPIALYLVALNVAGLDRGAYIYSPELHGLRKTGAWDTRINPAQAAYFGDIQVDRAALLVTFVYRVFDNARKYGDRALAFAFIEAGQIDQNLHLACNAVGLGSCNVGAFRKHEMEKWLGLDGLSQHVIHLTVVGRED